MDSAGALGGVDTLRLWTVQPLAFYEQAERSGRPLRADWERLVHGERFARQYEWMAARMKERFASYSGGPPIWAWLEPPESESPSGAFGEEAYEPHLLIRFGLPERSVLLSDFARWEEALLEKPVAPGPSDHERLRREVENMDCPGRFAGVYRGFVEDTWGRVFDLGAGTVQAVVEEIPQHRIEDVKPA